ncbi:MAG TPA: oxidoreductase [Planctomycetaceae bacterium]|nr:oxidoreductase [Planctomycetaceae bacterium]
MSRRVFDRRKFVAASSVAVAGWHTSSCASGRPSSLAKLNIACIGTANRAAADIEGVKEENVVALCDVDRKYLETKAKTFPDARLYADYREMIGAEGDKIDAVVIGTTDHHHAPATMHAIAAGKHVYCEKPLTHTVEEARIVAEAAAKAGVATQLGTQIHAGSNYRRVVEIIQSGAIGDVTDVHVWVGKAWGGGELPAKGDPVPEHLNWDLWLGPAKERPFALGRYHPAQWRKWWEFGQGTLGDMGCHYMDLPFWALRLRHPTRIEAEGPEVHAETAPLGLIVKYEFPKTEVAPAIKMTWYDGNLAPRKILDQRVPGSGVMFVGTEGMMFADYGSYRLFPAEKFADFTPPKKSIPESIGHHREWIQACKEGTPTTCNFDYSGALTETVLLGNIAYRSGRAVQWDAAKLETNDSESQAFVSKTYRDGWELPKV